MQIFRFILSAVLVLWLPGAAVLAWLPANRRSLSGQRFDLMAHLADSVALSVAISALIALWLFVANQTLGPLAVAALYGVFLAVLIGGLLRRLPTLSTELAGLQPWWAAAAFLVLLALIAFRFYQARMLVLPAWVDSVHHALIVRVIKEHGGLPADLSPYLSVSFSYHYAFHLIAALFSGWSGLPVETVLLKFGQVLNALVALSVYRLAHFYFNAGRDPSSAKWASCKPLLAALLVGFAFQMPAYYLTWGRYTLIVGLLLLGPLLAAAAEVNEAPANRSARVRLALLLAGVCLTHYFVVLLAALFMLLLSLMVIAKGIRQPAHWKALLHLGLIALVAFVAVSPWLWRVWQYNQSQADIQLTNLLNTDPSASAQVARYLTYFYQMIGPRRAHILYAVSGLGLLFALRRPHMRLLVGWSALLALMALPWGVRFDPFRPDHFAIVWFFPASIFIADLLVDGARALNWAAASRVGGFLLAGLTVAIIIWGVKETRNILNPATIFVTSADVRALDWIKANAPASARFYINGAHWQYGVYRGVDGGFWIPSYTARQSLIPPVIYSWGPAETAQQISRWAERSTRQRGCDSDLKELVGEAQLSHIYLHQGQGSLQPEMLADCDGLQRLYQQEGVYIFEILPAFFAAP